MLSTAKLARALRAVDVSSLLNAGDGLKYWDVDPLTNYRPVVEPCGPESFLCVHPKQLMAEGSYLKMPWLLGTIPEEGAVRVVNIMENRTLRGEFNARFDELLQELMEFPSDFSETKLAESMELILDEYFQNQHELNDSTVQGFLNVSSNVVDSLRNISLGMSSLYRSSRIVASSNRFIMPFGIMCTVLILASIHCTCTASTTSVPTALPRSTRMQMLPRNMVSYTAMI